MFFKIGQAINHSPRGVKHRAPGLELNLAHWSFGKCISGFSLSKVKMRVCGCVWCFHSGPTVTKKTPHNCFFITGHSDQFAISPVFYRPITYTLWESCGQIYYIYYSSVFSACRKSETWCVEVVLFKLLKDICGIQCVVKLRYTVRNGSFTVVWPSYIG